MLHDLYNFREKGGNQFWGVLPLSQGRKIFQKMLISIVTEFQYKLQWLWFSVVQNPIHHYFLVAIFVFAMQVCHSPQMLIQRWQFILLFDFGLFQNNLRPRSPGQIFCVLKLITRFLNTQRLFLTIHGKKSGYLEITRKILNTREKF